MKLAFTRALEAGLGHAPTRALTYMAATALDTQNKNGDPPDVYFEGRRMLARALGYGASNPDDWDSQAARRAVDRVIAELVDHGLIQLHERPHSGNEAIYTVAALRDPWSPSQRPSSRVEVRERRIEGNRRRVENYRKKHHVQRGSTPVDNSEESTTFNVDVGTTLNGRKAPRSTSRSTTFNVDPIGGTMRNQGGTTKRSEGETGKGAA